MTQVEQWCAVVSILSCTLALACVVWWMSSVRKQLLTLGNMIQYRRNRCCICSMTEPTHDVRRHWELQDAVDTMDMHRARIADGEERR